MSELKLRPPNWNYSDGPSGRKYCVPFTASCRRRRGDKGAGDGPRRYKFSERLPCSLAGLKPGLYSGWPFEAPDKLKLRPAKAKRAFFSG